MTQARSMGAPGKIGPARTAALTDVGWFQRIRLRDRGECQSPVPDVGAYDSFPAIGLQRSCSPWRSTVRCRVLDAKVDPLHLRVVLECLGLALENRAAGLEDVGVIGDF